MFVTLPLPQHHVHVAVRFTNTVVAGCSFLQFYLVHLLIDMAITFNLVKRHIVDHQVLGKSHVCAPPGHFFCIGFAHCIRASILR